MPVPAMSPHKVIVAILPKGRAMPVVQQLVEERGVTAVDVHYARGVGRITPLRHRGIGETAEKEVLTVTVPAADAEAIFEAIYTLAEINRPHGGLMYMHDAPRSTPFTLPDLPDEG